MDYLATILFYIFFFLIFAIPAYLMGRFVLLLSKTSKVLDNTLKEQEERKKQRLANEKL
jgi:hypothetical protein